MTDSYWTPFCIFLNLEPCVRIADSKGEKPVPTKPGVGVGQSWCKRGGATWGQGCLENQTGPVLTWEGGAETVTRGTHKEASRAGRTEQQEAQILGQE